MKHNGTDILGKGNEEKRRRHKGTDERERETQREREREREIGACACIMMGEIGGAYFECGCHVFSIRWENSLFSRSPSLSHTHNTHTISGISAWGRGGYLHVGDLNIWEVFFSIIISDIVFTEKKDIQNNIIIVILFCKKRKKGQKTIKNNEDRLISLTLDSD